MALTPIRMASLDEVGEDSLIDEESTRKYLESCKSAEYVRADGKPGLTILYIGDGAVSGHQL